MRKKVPDRVQEGVEGEGEVEGGEDEVEEAEEVEAAEEVEEVEEAEEEAEEAEEVEEGEEEGGIWHLKDTLQRTAFGQQLSSTWT